MQNIVYSMSRQSLQLNIWMEQNKDLIPIGALITSTCSEREAIVELCQFRISKIMKKLKKIQD